MQPSLQKSACAMRFLDSQRQSGRPPLGFKMTNSHSRSETPSKSTDFKVSESLTQLKLTAEKMMQEQACVKADLQVAHSKLEKSERDVRELESKLQETRNENAFLKGKQQEALKLWGGLESKFSSTKTFCDQLTESLQQLSVEVKEAEQARQTLEEKLAERLKFYQDTKLQIDDLLLKKEHAETTAENWRKEYVELKQQHEHLNLTLAQHTERIHALELEKVEILRSSDESLREEHARLEAVQRDLDQLQSELSMKVEELTLLHGMHTQLVKMKDEVDIQTEDLRTKLAFETEKNINLKDEIEQLITRVKLLDDANTVASETVNKLLAEIARLTELTREERRLKEEKSKELEVLSSQHEELVHLKDAQNGQLEDLRAKLLDLNQRHEVAFKERAEEVRSLQEEVEVAQRKFEGVLNEKLELMNQARCLQEHIASITKTMEELTTKQDHLLTENVNLKAEIDTTNVNANQKLQEKVDELEMLRTRLTKTAEALSAHESEVFQLRQSCLDKERALDELQEQHKCLRDQHEELRQSFLGKETSLDELQEEHKCLKDQHAEVLNQKMSAERHGQEVRRQAEIELEAKQIELSKHLKEISERNDQEMMDIRRKYEAETKEAILIEEQKAKSMLEKMQKDCELQVAKAQRDSLEQRKACEEAFQAQLKDVIQLQEKEKSLALAQHNEEVKRNRDFIQRLESEKRQLAQAWESKIGELRKKHEEEIKKCSADKSLQYSKVEERASYLEHQVTNLKEQLKAEKVKREEDSKASRKKYEDAVRKFEADRKMLDNSKVGIQTVDEMKRKALVWEVKHPCSEKKDAKVMTGGGRGGELQEPATPAANQVSCPITKGINNDIRQTESDQEKGKCESVSLPRHSKTITHHEYEVATSDGKKTITRRKRTKSTVMIEGQSSPLEMKKIGSRKSARVTSQQRKVKPKKVYGSTIGDLFAGKSLDPYADDPYAFN